MPLYEGLGSGGEKTAVVMDLGEAFTKWRRSPACPFVPQLALPSDERSCGGFSLVPLAAVVRSRQIQLCVLVSCCQIKRNGPERHPCLYPQHAGISRCVGKPQLPPHSCPSPCTSREKEAA